MSGHAPPIVAVVDDDPRILESLEELLESAGYEVRIHSSGASFLARDISKIDCLITDVGMPAMDGFELLARVKQLRPELPVFLISGRRDLLQDRQARGGDTEFFFKPFDGAALLSALGNALKRRLADGQQ